MTGGGKYFDETISLPLLPYLDLAILSLVEGAVQLHFNSFSKGSIPYVVVDLVYLWEEVNSGFSVLPSWTTFYS